MFQFFLQSSLQFWKSTKRKKRWDLIITLTYGNLPYAKKLLPKRSTWHHNSEWRNKWSDHCCFCCCCFFFCCCCFFFISNLNFQQQAQNVLILTRDTLASYRSQRMASRRRWCWWALHALYDRPQQRPSPRRFISKIGRKIYRKKGVWKPSYWPDRLSM